MTSGEKPNRIKTTTTRNKSVERATKSSRGSQSGEVIHHQDHWRLPVNLSTKKTKKTKPHIPS